MRLTQSLLWIFRPLLLRYMLWRHGGIWGFKSFLQRSTPSRALVQIYESYFARMGSWIGYKSHFAGTPCFPHGPVGVFISNEAVIGRNVVIFQQVTIGSNTLNDTSLPGSPTIGDQVYIGAGAKIIGGITVADNCRIGANAVVYSDLPPSTLAVQAPTRLLHREQMDNRYFTVRPDGMRVFFEDGRWVPDVSGGIDQVQEPEL